MEIKHKDNEVTFVKKAITHTFDVNGKEVFVYEHITNSNHGDNEHDFDIDEKDGDILTTEESEALDDFIAENL